MLRGLNCSGAIRVIIYYHFHLYLELKISIHKNFLGTSPYKLLFAITQTLTFLKTFSSFFFSFSFFLTHTVHARITHTRTQAGRHEHARTHSLAETDPRRKVKKRETKRPREEEEEEGGDGGLEGGKEEGEDYTGEG